MGYEEELATINKGQFDLLIKDYSLLSFEEIEALKRFVDNK